MSKQLFLLGETYLTQGGKLVRIIAVRDGSKDGVIYVQGDDGKDVYVNGNLVHTRQQAGWRIANGSRAGQVAGGSWNDMLPDNLVKPVQVEV